MAEGIEAIVLRTLRYGEADLIAHVFTRTGGRRGVIAKGARRPKSRLGARLEPFLAISLQLVEGRGDLAVVRGVEVTAAHQQVRASYRAQQIGAAAVDLVQRLTTEHEAAEPIYHLLRSFMDQLDALAGAAPPAAGPSDLLHDAALLVAFQLKLLHAVGIAPQLGMCVRCGDEQALAAFAPADGGVVCAGCRTAGDSSIDHATHAGAVLLMREPLARIASVAAEELPVPRVLRTVAAGIVAATCLAHAGVRPRALP